MSFVSGRYDNMQCRGAKRPDRQVFLFFQMQKFWQLFSPPPGKIYIWDIKANVMMWNLSVHCQRLLYFLVMFLQRLLVKNVSVLEITNRIRGCTTVRNSDDKAIPLGSYTNLHFINNSSIISSVASVHQQHQRISISASASAHQQHQRISSINASVIGIGNISAHIHQIRSYQSISINITRRAPDTTRHAPDTIRYGPDTTRYHHTCIIYGLYGLKHHIVEISGDVTVAGRDNNQR